MECLHAGALRAPRILDRVRYPIVQTEWEGRCIPGVRPDRIMHVRSSPGFPQGRKSLLMAEVWQQARSDGACGVLWIDPDVAPDVDDYRAMHDSVQNAPLAMHTGMVKLWPGSTGRTDWIWSHRGGTLGNPVATQDEYIPIAYIAMGFVFTPARLLDLCMDMFPVWSFPDIDVGVSEVALVNGVDIIGVHECRPKHLHY